MILLKIFERSESFWVGNVIKSYEHIPKRDILLECYFSFELTLFISLYLKIAKLSLLECFIFHLGPTEPSVKLKKIPKIKIV